MRKLEKERIIELIFMSLVFIGIFLTYFLVKHYTVTIGEDSYSVGYIQYLTVGSFIISGKTVVLERLLPIAILVLALFISSAAVYYFTFFVLKDYKYQKIIYVLSMVLLIAGAILSLCSDKLLLGLGKNVVFDKLKIEKMNTYFNTAYIFIAVGYGLTKIFQGTKFSVNDISEIAIFCALALVLDKVKIPVQIAGGSINLSAVPLMILSIRLGFVKGLISSSLIFGFFSCLLDGYGLATFPFDYLIGFSGYAFVGLFYGIFKNLFKNKKVFLGEIIGTFIGLVIACFMRYVGGMLSGAILYEMSDFGENFIYQSSYIVGSIILDAVVVIVLLKPIDLSLKVFPPKKLFKKE